MRAIALVALTSLSGCSFAFVSGPPANHQQLPYFECSSGRTVPVLDSIFAAINVLNLIGLSGQSDAEYDANIGGSTHTTRQTNMAVNTGFALLAGAGAYYGFTKSGQCRAAKQEMMIRMTNGQQPMQPMQPGPGSWPPPGPPMPAPAPAPAPVPEPGPSPDPYAPN